MCNVEKHKQMVLGLTHTMLDAVVVSAFHVLQHTYPLHSRMQKAEALAMN